MCELSIILVNWNCLAYTEQCLASIYAVPEAMDYEVIVVDNASADSPCRTLVERFPRVKLILSKQNIGFGRANNLAAERALGQNLLFLNPDTIVLGDALQTMMRALRSVPEAGAVGCRLLNTDGSLQDSSVQRFPTVWNQLLAIDWVKRRWPTVPSLPAKAGEMASIQRVDVVSGACLLVRRAVFQEVGCFNPEYFMYAEEVDLCYSIWKLGWNVVHEGSAQVTHFGGQSTKGREDGFADLAMRESVHRFLRQTRGRRYALLYRATLCFSALCRLTLVGSLALLTLVFNRPLQRSKAISIWHKWLRIARWSLGLNGWVAGGTVVDRARKTGSPTLLRD